MREISEIKLIGNLNAAEAFIAQSYATNKQNSNKVKIPHNLMDSAKQPHFHYEVL